MLYTYREGFCGEKGNIVCEILIDSLLPGKFYLPLVLLKFFFFILFYVEKNSPVINHSTAMPATRKYAKTESEHETILD